MGKLRGLVFGFKQRRSEKEKKVSLSQVVQAVERSEIRSNEFTSRAKNDHAKATLAIKQKRDSEAKLHLKNWAYHKGMGDIYLQAHTNMQRQLDTMQQTEDIKIFSEAYTSALQWMNQQSKMIDYQNLVRQRAELRADNRQVDMSMRAVSKQFGVSSHSPEIDEEFLRIKDDLSVGTPNPFGSEEIPEIEPTLITPNPLSKPKREVEREGSNL
ncbi:MAG: hypothetical protein ACW976_05330 [Candidatus Ranarchaeia archaeon]|jgi:hypothetical protein